MKKKTFGRIAALGLAGLTAVPVVSIAASANVELSTKTDAESGKQLITGDAYKISWDVRKITHNYSYSEVDKKVVDAATEVIDRTSVNIGDSAYKLKETRYYARATNAGTIPSDIRAKTANTTFNEDKTEFENKCDDYKFYKQYDNTQTSGSHVVKSGANKGTTVYFGNKAAVGEPVDYGFYTMTGTVKTAYVYQITDVPTYSGENIEYKIELNPTQTKISLATLASPSELGASFVSIDNATNQITAATASTDGAYKISTTGATTDTTTPAGTYSSIYDAIDAYPYATYCDASYYYGGVYWPSLQALRNYYGSTAVSYTIVPITASEYKMASGRRYFDFYSNRYYSYSQGYTYPLINLTSSTYNASTNVLYYSSYTHLYYPSYSEAVNASNGNSSYVSSSSTIPTYATYLCMKDGKFYSTYASALSAAGNNSSYVRALNGASTTTSTLDYLDPYYYYYMMGTRLPSTTTSTNSGSVKIGNSTGWSAVTYYTNRASNGSTLSVAMNNETVVPSSVLSSIKGRNVTVKFTLSNGVVYAINGKDVTSAKDIDIETVYNTKNVPSKLVSKAKSKNDAVASSQISIEGGSFGSSADVTVKFATKRAGCTARLYRYNSDRNSLSLVDKSNVGSDGKCTFDNVTKGGDFVIILS